MPKPLSIKSRVRLPAFEYHQHYPHHPICTSHKHNNTRPDSPEGLPGHIQFDKQRIYWSLVWDLIACTISNTLLMTRMGSVMRRTTRNQSIGRWSVCTNKLTKTAMTSSILISKKRTSNSERHATHVALAPLGVVLDVGIGAFLQLGEHVLHPAPAERALISSS